MQPLDRNESVCENRMTLYGYGASPGVPDLLVRHPDWEPPGVWLAIETKGSHTPLNAAQKALYAAGAIVVARSVQAALLAVQQTSSHFNGR